MAVLVIDNDDSFTTSLVQHSSEIDADFTVIRNDVMTVDEMVTTRWAWVASIAGTERPR